MLLGRRALVATLTCAVLASCGAPASRFPGPPTTPPPAPTFAPASSVSVLDPIGTTIEPPTDSTDATLDPATGSTVPGSSIPGTDIAPTDSTDSTGGSEPTTDTTAVLPETPVSTDAL